MLVIILFSIPVVLLFVAVILRLSGSAKKKEPAKKAAESSGPETPTEPIRPAYVRPRPPIVLYHVPFVVILICVLLVSTIGYLLYYYGVPIHHFR